MLSRRALGARGEETAATYLLAHRYEILHRNFRCPAGEIDIIARIEGTDGPVLVFVEVKLRIGTAHGTGAAAVNGPKQRRLVASALHYISAHPPSLDEPAIRFDVIEIAPDNNNGFSLNHHIGAFTAD